MILPGRAATYAAIHKHRPVQPHGCLFLKFKTLFRSEDLMNSRTNTLLQAGRDAAKGVIRLVTGGRYPRPVPVPSTAPVEPELVPYSTKVPKIDTSFIARRYVKLVTEKIDDLVAEYNGANLVRVLDLA